MATLTVEFPDELAADVEDYLERHLRYRDAGDLTRAAVEEAVAGAPRASSDDVELSNRNSDGADAVSDGE